MRSYPVPQGKLVYYLRAGSCNRSQMTQFGRGTPESNSFVQPCDSIGGIILRSIFSKYQVQSVNIGSHMDKGTAVETHNSHRYASKTGSALRGCLFSCTCSRNMGLYIMHWILMKILCHCFCSANGPNVRSLLTSSNYSFSSLIG